MGHRMSVVVLPQGFVEHVSSDCLERYLLRTLPASEMARVAEHLPVCDECRTRLVATNEFVSAIRAHDGSFLYVCARF
jgi:hypothetical protein